MTQVATTTAIIREEKFASLAGMGEAALSTASHEMTRTMVTSTATRKETRYVCETGKDHLVRAVSRTGSVLAALLTVCLRIMMR